MGGRCSVFNTLGKEPSTPLAYDLGLEHQHPTKSMIVGHGVLSEIVMYGFFYCI